MHGSRHKTVGNVVSNFCFSDVMVICRNRHSVSNSELLISRLIWIIEVLGKMTWTVILSNDIWITNLKYIHPFVQFDLQEILIVLGFCPLSPHLKL